jgi:ribosome-associated translation inhibitor RaiA
MMELALGGNIVLVGFRLDGQEMILVKKIVGNYAKKIRNFAEYNQMKVELRTHKKSKQEEYEAKVDLDVDGKMITSEDRGVNPYSLIDSVLKKVLHEVQHQTTK